MPERAEFLTREEILAELRELANSGDPESAHIRADALLLRQLDDREIAEAFEVIPKWYA